jgi:hypothetical protein
MVSKLGDEQILAGAFYTIRCSSIIRLDQAGFPRVGRLKA